MAWRSDEDVDVRQAGPRHARAARLAWPVALTPAKLEQQLRGPETDYEPRLKEAFAKVSAGRDVMVLEGGRSLREGYVVDLPPQQVVELLGCAVLLAVLQHDADLMVDRALTAQWYFAEQLPGSSSSTRCPRAQLDYVRTWSCRTSPGTASRCSACCPRSNCWRPRPCRELAEGLKAEILCCTEGNDELVEHMLVGAMSVESALSYFRRKPNKAVITGGDRADIQLAALETSTRCLILTGNLYPSPAVLNRAEELHVPVCWSTWTRWRTIEIIEGFFGRSRFQQPQKISRFTALLNEHFDFAALYEGLGIKK